MTTPDTSAEVERIRARVATSHGHVPDTLMSQYERVWRNQCDTLLAEIDRLRAQTDTVRRHRIDPGMERTIRTAVAALPHELGPEHQRWVEALLAEIDALRSRYSDPDDADAQRAIDLDAYVGALHRVTDAEVSYWGAEVEKRDAEIDRLRARLPDPAAAQRAREMAARVIDVSLCDAYDHVDPGDTARQTASDCVATLYDLARTVRARTDVGGFVDHLTLLDVALRVDACTSLAELEAIARELREVG